MNKKVIVAGGLALLVVGVGFWPVGGGLASSVPSRARTETAMDLTAYSAAPPGRPLRLLFIHHSVGGQLLADPGPDVGERSIYASHPWGGGLRALLRQNGYAIGEASYGSRLGEHTDLFDWLPKFRDHMDEVLSLAQQDEPLPEGERNDVVVFKSCFPNSRLIGRGEGEGEPDGPALTLANAKATMRALLPTFAAHGDTLFVYVTAPPLAPRVESQPLLETLVRKLLSRSWGREELARSGELARELNTWLTAPDGWLAGYQGDNVVVFDYWDVLTGEGRSNLLHYYAGEGTDSHPTGAGQRLAAPRLVETLNRAVRRAGLASDGVADNGVADNGVADNGVASDEVADNSVADNQVDGSGRSSPSANLSPE